MNEWMKGAFEMPDFEKSLNPVRTQFFHKVEVIFMAVMLLLLVTSLQNLFDVLISL